MKKIKGHFWSLSTRPPVNPPIQKTKKLTEKIDISLRKFKKIKSPKMVSKRLKNHYLRSYDQFFKNGFSIKFLTTKWTRNAILATERGWVGEGARKKIH